MLTLVGNVGTSAAQNALQAPTPKILLAGTRIPKQTYSKINLTRQGRKVPIINNINKTLVITYIAYTIINYLYKGLIDGELFSSFCEDYKGWTEAIFKRVKKEYVRELKRVLCYKGVATGQVNKNLVPTLVDLLA